MTRPLLTAAIVAGLAATAFGSAANAESNGAGGVTGPAFYVDGELYRTVGTPTDLTNTRAPAHSFDTIYAIPGQRSVATAAPGDRGYNGGRWRVQPLAVVGDLAGADANGSGDLDSDEEVDAALAMGLATLGAVEVSFVCPVIPLR
jgi:hypothetical protein